MNFAALKTVSGHDLGEVLSALQKTCRRSEVDNALHWCAELDLSGFAGHAWSRLVVITSEDVGLADRGMPSVVRALRESYLEAAKRKNAHHPERLFLLHAAALVATSPKSRLIDHGCVVHFQGHARREIPPEAVDRHTVAGRRAGRGWEHFWNEASKLTPESTIPDPYRARAEELLRDETLKNGVLFDGE
jgi:replication-associated recombination protein RarA